MVLVAHSYGGAVISNAATGNNQVKALVFLAGWALDEGESIEQLLGLNEGSLVLPSLRQVPFTNPDGSEGADLYLDQEAFPATFAGDVDPETARVMAATQRPWSAAARSCIGRRGAPGVRVRFRRSPCATGRRFAGKAVAELLTEGARRRLQPRLRTTPVAPRRRSGHRARARSSSEGQ